MDPMLPPVVGAAFAVVTIGLVLRRLHQPHVVAYLVAGVVLGPHGLGVFTDVQAATRFGDVGVVLLLFFVGMEVSLPQLLRSWRVSVVGTTLQIGVTCGLALALGEVLEWPVGRSVLLGFVVSLSSTAVVVSVLRDRDALDSPVGLDAVGVLLVQDLALVPMLLLVGLLSGAGGDASSDAPFQLLGGAAIVGLVVFIVRRGRIHLPLSSRLEQDHELQVFAAFVLCFGFATLTAWLELSTALGAFVAGIVVGSADETDWVHHSLESLRILLVALFFVAIGMLIDLEFVADHAVLLGSLVLGVLLLNTALNAAILHALGRPRAIALEVGAFLAPVGEFSFVLAAVGLQQGLVSDFGYHLSVGLIALSLMASPAWSALTHRLSGARDDAWAQETPSSAPAP